MARKWEYGGGNSEGEVRFADQCEMFATGLDPHKPHVLEIVPCEEQPLKDGLKFDLGVIAVFVDTFIMERQVSSC